ncbi:molybdopterin cofactor-binding domain-containing protein [Allopontixanthobacter sediminis]|uniref:Molybdopterin-dependent oxidoreductase n=1 Tax=Allopontixanthobacter sediminis TaxID=1689985 RepID=A0A845B5V2_9SPHN|nr:molybdopterin cofactor-binding domain-containing protein [Allopontixanthobacter sediminis]MXP45524.1 molybdopterin-dependent oxidoreductase [Allopontixanthobacter sediminis]
MQFSRRNVLVGAAIGGGLVAAWTLRPRSFSTPLAPGRGEYAFDAWLKIGKDGVITVAVPQLEMGQGITTLLPQIVAVELGADWRQVAVEPAPVSGAYANIPLAARWASLWMPALPGLANDADDLLAQRYAQESRFNVTADGTSLAAYEMPCRAAAASARAMLAMAAADRWGISWEECIAEGGFIRAGDMRLSFAELVEEAAEYTPPDPPPLLPEGAAEDPIFGLADAPTAFPRLDLPSKVDGSYLFAGDVRLPDMLYASIRHGPVNQAVLSRFEAGEAAGMPGLGTIVKGKRWLAAVADSWWSADQALTRMDPRFDVDEAVNSSTIEAVLDEAVRRGEATRIAVRGEGDSLMEKTQVARRYDFAPATHATLETTTVTARYGDGRLELWMATQAPEAAREAAARTLGISASDVVLYPMPAGGSFDRRLEHDHAVEAALIAREVSKDGVRPVQLMWPRGQELLSGKPRMPAAVLVSAKLGRGDGNVGTGGEIETLRVRMAAPASGKEFGHRLFGNKTNWAAIENAAGEADPMVMEGAMPPYSIPNVALDHVPVRIGLPTGRMRGNAHGITAFVTESFVDEMAWKHGREPLSYRIEMLGSDLRLARCLQDVARLAQWDGGKDQSGQGLACHRIGEGEDAGRIACIATARRDGGGARVTRLTAVADIGRIVNLDIARQQIEGGLLFGMALALGSALEYVDGVPTTKRLGSLGLPSLVDCPEVEVDFISSKAAPFDPGELGVAVAAPAIANALYSATGLRIRRLPLFADGL